MQQSNGTCARNRVFVFCILLLVLFYREWCCNSVHVHSFLWDVGDADALAQRAVQLPVAKQGVTPGIQTSKTQFSHHHIALIVGFYYLSFLFLTFICALPPLARRCHHDHTRSSLTARRIGKASHSRDRSTTGRRYQCVKCYLLLQSDANRVCLAAPPQSLVDKHHNLAATALAETPPTNQEPVQIQTRTVRHPVQGPIDRLDADAPSRAASSALVHERRAPWRRKFRPKLTKTSRVRLRGTAVRLRSMKPVVRSDGLFV